MVGEGSEEIPFELEEAQDQPSQSSSGSSSFRSVRSEATPLERPPQVERVEEEGLEYVTPPMTEGSTTTEAMDEGASEEGDDSSLRWVFML